ncbi:hypothetical protein FOBRF1_013094 [Fusarium oxysporum]
MSPTVSKPTAILLTDETTIPFTKWFRKEDKHIGVLALAWAYALSARWTCLIADATPIEYTSSKARWATDQLTHDEKSSIVELGLIDEDAARWWSAVLAPEQGWKASIPNGKYQFLSPWSTTLASACRLVLAGTRRNASLDHQQCPTFDTAVQYIKGYCALHSLDAQNRTALVAALFSPLANLERRTVQLPLPQSSFKPSSAASQDSIWGSDVHQFDRLLTLSCNPQGIKSVLGSVFYEPSVQSNLCGAWLQGTFAVLRSKCASDVHGLIHLLSLRSPHLSFLWLGAIITSTHRTFIKDTRSLLGFGVADLHEAAWTGTISSFTQEPVSYHYDDLDHISRANE